MGAGYAIGIAGDAGVRGTGQQPRLFVGMILILIFSEVRTSGRISNRAQTNAGARSVRHDCGARVIGQGLIISLLPQLHRSTFISIRA